MKLLSKTGIAQAKAVVQKQTIDEGVKIAKRIDRLREVEAAEAVSLAKFREKTLKQIHDDTQKALAERDEAREDVRKARAEAANNRLPLDAEWKEVGAARAKAESDQETANITLANAHEAKREAKEAVKSASDVLLRATTKDDVARNHLKEAAADRRKAATLLRNAEKTSEKVLTKCKSREDAVAHREMMVEGRENGVTIWEAKLTEGQTALDEGRRLLNDRQRTFERTIKRAS